MPTPRIRPGLLLLVFGTGLVFVPGRAWTAGEPSPARQVLVLRNDATLIGQVERVEDHYRVRTDFGDTLIPVKDAAKVCETVHEGYKYLRERANLRDPDERLRLARWCIKQGLLDDARKEAQESLHLQPRYADAQALLRVIDRLIDEGKVARPQESDDKLAFAADTQKHHRAVTPPRLDLAYDSESLQTFTKQIQPILSNTCATAGCHGGDKGGEFRFTRITGGFTASVTRENLARTLPFIDSEDPGNSPLLRKALEPHGGASRPALPTRDSRAFRALEDWAYGVVPNSNPPAVASDKPDSPIRPLPIERPLDNKPVMTTPRPDSPTLPGIIKIEPGQVPGKDPSSPIVVAPPDRSKPALKPPKDALKGGEIVADTKPKPGERVDLTPVKPGETKPPLKPPSFTTVDPFDPEIFNRQIHRDR